MDIKHFDYLTRAVSRVLSRRALTATLGLAALGLPELADAKKKRNKKKIKRNAFGCVNVGGFCKNGGHCCSGICKKNKCEAHDVATCQAGQTVNFCVLGTENIICDGLDEGTFGRCSTTTGNAGYCGIDLLCASCTKDADCESLCGEGAACLICPDCAISSGSATACAGRVPQSCA